MKYMDRVYRNYRETTYSAVDEAQRRALFEIDWREAHEENAEWDAKHPVANKLPPGVCAWCVCVHDMPT